MSPGRGELSSPPNFPYLVHVLQAKQPLHTPRSSLACYSKKHPAIYFELINLHQPVVLLHLWSSSNPSLWVGKARGGHLASVQWPDDWQPRGGVNPRPLIPGTKQQAEIQHFTILASSLFLTSTCCGSFFFWTLQHQSLPSPQLGEEITKLCLYLGGLSGTLRPGGSAAGEDEEVAVGSQDD